MNDDTPRDSVSELGRNHRIILNGEMGSAFLPDGCNLEDKTKPIFPRLP